MKIKSKWEAGKIKITKVEIVGGGVEWILDGLMVSESVQQVFTRVNETSYFWYPT